jgi:hypothetical protein
MKSGQFTNEQIVAILQKAQKDEKPILALCKDKGYGAERVVTSKGCLLPNLKTCAWERTQKQAGV